MAKAVKLGRYCGTGWCQHGNCFKGFVRTKRRQRGSAGENKEILQKNLDTAVLQRRNGSLRKNNIISES